MGTGTFQFNGFTIQSLLVGTISPVAVDEHGILHCAQPDYRLWTVDAYITAQFTVTVDGRALVIPTHEVLPAQLVRECREVLSGLNSFNTIWGGAAKERAKRQIASMLDCNAVRKASHAAMVHAEEVRAQFEYALENALHDAHMDLKELVQGRLVLMRYLR